MSTMNQRNKSSLDSYLDLCRNIAPRWVIVGVVIFTGLPGCATADRRMAAKQDRYALLVGIDEYESVSPLGGCVNDVKDMSQVLRSRFGFTDRQVKLLTNKEATHAAIIRELRALRDRVQPNGVVVVHYSGHGSQMQDISGDEKVDHLDETIVPVDSRANDVFDITDDDLFGILSELSTVTTNVTLIFDSCHSGAIAKGGGRARFVKPDTRPPPPPAPYARHSPNAGNDDELAFATSPYVWISGCRADQVSYEATIVGIDRGALSYHLVKALREFSKATTTHRDVFKMAWANVRNEFPQEPQLEGEGADRVVFGLESIATRPFYVVTPESDGAVRIEAGAVNGITMNSEFDIFPDDEKEFVNQSRALARVEVVEVTRDSALARVVTRYQQRTLPIAARAVLRKRVSEAPLLSVLFENRINPILGKVAEKLATDSAFQVLDDGENKASRADFFVSVRGDQLVIEGLSGLAERKQSGTIEPNKEDQIIEWAVRELRRWSVWSERWSRSNPHSSLQVDFDVSAPIIKGARGAVIQIGAPDVTILAGEPVVVSVTNKSISPLFFYLAAVSTDGTWDVLFPKNGSRESLAVGQTWTSRLPTSLKNEVRLFDKLKLFASTGELDDSDYRTETRKGAVGKPEDVGQWTVVDRLVEVVRKRP